jgi:hypothetical protein
VRNGYAKYVADKVGWPVNWWPTLPEPGPRAWTL